MLSKPTKAFRPTSAVPSKGERRLVVHDTSKTVQKPKKKRKRDARELDLDLFTTEQLIERSKAATVRRAKLSRADLFSNAKEASDAQIYKLSAELGHPPSSVYCGFVCWANGYYFGTPYTLTKWGKGLYISRIFWIRAIEMALNGSNDLFSAADLVAMSFGYEDDFDMMRDQFARKILEG